MSNRVDLAKQLLRDGEFSIAKQMLQNESNDSQALYLLSLLYRYDDEYDLEKTIIDKALDIDGSNTYMRERLDWHNLPIFDRVVPRQPLHLPRDPKTIPSAEVLDQLCIVTSGGSDEPFRQLLIELLESLEATRSYKDIPVYIFDTGLTDDDKHFLLNRFSNIKKILDPEWDIDLTKHSGYVAQKNNMNSYKATTARIFMNKHFPKHRYYLWIDTDCWIQDERALDELIYFACQQGIGICPDVVPHRTFYLGMMHIPDHYKNDEFMKVHPATDALFCIDAETSIFDMFQQKFLELYAFGGFSHFIGQFAINLILQKDGKELTLADLQRTLYNVSTNALAGCPLIYGNNHLLNSQKELIGVVHLTWNSKFLQPYFRPLIKSTSSKISLAYSNEIENKFWSNQLQPEPDIKYSSVCYRTWPWVGKKVIKNLLMDK